MLAELGPEVLLTDSGLETDLLYNQGVDLPQFAAFPLVDDPAGARRLRDYFTAHAAVAACAGVGFVLEAPTWRASADWGAALGYDTAALDAVNRRAVELLLEVRAEFAGAGWPHPISGCVGPRADAYQPDHHMSADESAAYHRAQIETFAASEADLVTAMTLAYPAEAVGIARAARAAGIAVVLSFTVETDGRLPDHSTLAEAITAVDDATDRYPSYYMINCAHPSHFAAVLDVDEPWVARLRGVRANASRRSHAELDTATELDAGDPVALGRAYAQLRSRHPALTVLGGCCGTDLRHVEQIAAACL